MDSFVKVLCYKQQYLAKLVLQLTVFVLTNNILFGIGKRITVVTTTQKCCFFSYLKELFPNSKFILMLRDGRATAHSIISRQVTISGFDITSYRLVDPLCFTTGFACPLIEASCVAVMMAVLQRTWRKVNL